MPAIGRFGRQLTSLLWRDSVADQVDAELDFHLEMVTLELIEHGMSREAACAQALQRFGDIQSVNAECRKIGLKAERETRRTEYLAELRQDAVHALRQLRRAPGFTAVALLTLILAIGANTAIFSLVSAVLLRPLPYPAADRLTVLWGAVGDQKQNLVSIPDVKEWRARNRTFAEMGIIRAQSINLTGAERPDRLLGSFITANVLRLLGARAGQGRLFTDEETAEGGGQALAVLSDAVWKTRFGADPRIVGKTLTLNGRPHVVIGVVSKEFRDLFDQTEVWLPITSAPNPNWFTRDNPAVWVIGLLKTGITHDQAQRDLSEIARQLGTEYPATNAGTGVTVLSLRDYLVGQVRPTLLLVFGFVGVVLLIACANITNLQLARSLSRRREISLRAALGAGQGRLVRQLLTESLVLSVLGGVAGILVARGGIDALVAAVPGGLPSFTRIALDWRVLLFSAGITIAAGLLFGAMPAVYAARVDLGESLQMRAAEGTLGGKGDIRQAFVAVQLALCIVLLVGAGLLTRSLARLQQERLGFDPENLLTAEFRLPSNKYQSDERVAQFASSVLERIRAVPGVHSAALSVAVPLSGNWATTTYQTEGQAPSSAGALPTAQWNAVTDGFFLTMGIPMMQGRDFDDTDRAGSSPVAIVNQELARRAWPGQSAIGKQLRIFGPPEIWVTVVGVVGNAKQFTISETRGGAGLSTQGAESRDLLQRRGPDRGGPDDAGGSGAQGDLGSRSGSTSLEDPLDAVPGRSGCGAAAIHHHAHRFLRAPRAPVGRGRRVRRHVVYGGAAHSGDRDSYRPRRGPGAGGAHGSRARTVDHRRGDDAWTGHLLCRREIHPKPALRRVGHRLRHLRGRAHALAAVAALACYLPARRAARVDPVVALQAE